MPESLAESQRGDSKQRTGFLPSRTSFLVDLVRRAGTVAHVGCTDWPYTEERIRTRSLLHDVLVRETSSRVDGIDVDSAGLEVLRSKSIGRRFYEVDLSAGCPEELLGQYDLVVAGEVLEHVANPGSFLRGCAGLVNAKGHVCVTVPNACSPKVGLRSLWATEIVHPDHFVYYSPRTLRRTLDAAGLELTELYTCFAEALTDDSQSLRKGQANTLLGFAHRFGSGPVGDSLVAVAALA